MAFYDFNQIEFKQKRDKVFMKVISGENVQLVLIKLKPGATTWHSHPHEQMGYILSGKVAITIVDERKVCGPGEAYHVPSHVKHGFEVLGEEDLQYIEIFSPPKDENCF